MQRTVTISRFGRVVRGVYNADAARIGRDFVNNPAKFLPHSVFSSKTPHGVCGLSSYSNSVRVNRGWAWCLKLSIVGSQGDATVRR
jgi:hypothetical protein